MLNYRPTPWIDPEKDQLLRELETTKDHLNTLLKQHEELEVKSKSDIKVLVKEVKSLRGSQIELKQKLNDSLQEKTEVEQLLRQEMERSEIAEAAKTKLLHDCQMRQIRLQESNVSFVDNNFSVDSSSLPNVLDLLTESDKQIALLLAESQCLTLETDTLSKCDAMKTMDHELRIMLTKIFSDSAELRKQVNLFLRTTLQIDSSTNENGFQVLTRETMLKQLSEF